MLTAPRPCRGHVARSGRADGRPTVPTAGVDVALVCPTQPALSSRSALSRRAPHWPRTCPRYGCCGGRARQRQDADELVWPRPTRSNGTRLEVRERIAAGWHDGIVPAAREGKPVAACEAWPNRRAAMRKLTGMRAAQSMAAGGCSGWMNARAAGRRRPETHASHSPRPRRPPSGMHRSTAGLTAILIAATRRTRAAARPATTCRVPGI